MSMKQIQPQSTEKPSGDSIGTNNSAVELHDTSSNNLANTSTLNSAGAVVGLGNAADSTQSYSQDQNCEVSEEENFMFTLETGTSWDLLNFLQQSHGFISMNIPNRYYQY